MRRSLPVTGPLEAATSAAGGRSVCLSAGRLPWADLGLAPGSPSVSVTLETPALQVYFLSSVRPAAQLQLNTRVLILGVNLTVRKQRTRVCGSPTWVLRPVTGNLHGRFLLPEGFVGRWGSSKKPQETTAGSVGSLPVPPPALWTGHVSGTRGQPQLTASEAARPQLTQPCQQPWRQPGSDSCLQEVPRTWLAHASCGWWAPRAAGPGEATLLPAPWNVQPVESHRVLECLVQQPRATDILFCRTGGSILVSWSLWSQHSMCGFPAQLTRRTPQPQRGARWAVRENSQAGYKSWSRGLCAQRHGASGRHLGGHSGPLGALPPLAHPAGGLAARWL